jgi:predicted nucleic acid-binding protein
MILLETNVVSELMRPTPDGKVRAWLCQLGVMPVATTVVSVSKIIFGLARLPRGKRRSDRSDRFDRLLLGPPALPVLALDDASGR